MDLFQSIDLTVQHMLHVIKVHIYEEKLSPIFAALVLTLIPWVPEVFLARRMDFLDLNCLAIGSAPSKKSRSGPEVFRAGHNRDMTDTGNRARKTSGTQGITLTTQLKIL